MTKMQEMMMPTTCQGCSLPIKDQYIFKVLPDMQWHEHCLKCVECDCPLTETCFIRNNKAYCRQDYFKFSQSPQQQQQQQQGNVLKLTNCSKCALPLSRNDLVMKSKERMFHMDCFKCSICARKLAPGEEYCHQEESNTLLCKDDVHMQAHPAIASSSPKFMGNGLYLTTNQQRYQQSENSNSFSPSTTSSSSSSSSSSVTDSPSNNHSYNLMNSSFQSSQLSYSALVDMPTTTALTNGVTANGVVNSQGRSAPNVNGRYNDFNQGNNNTNGISTTDSDVDSDTDEDRDTNEDSDDENLIDDNDQSLTDDETSFTEKKKKSTSKSKGANKPHNMYKSSPDSLLMQINHNHQYMGNAIGTGGGAGSSSKPARIRTVLNEKQLHTLRACYGANPRPDALMKEQLVEMTGLNPRVIRVWFQNKRCKDKKKNMLRPPGCGEHVTTLQHAGYQQQQLPQQQVQPQFGNPMGHVQHQSNQYNSHLMFDHCF